LLSEETKSDLKLFLEATMLMLSLKPSRHDKAINKRGVCVCVWLFLLPKRAAANATKGSSRAIQIRGWDLYLMCICVYIYISRIHNGKAWRYDELHRETPTNELNSLWVQDRAAEWSLSPFSSIAATSVLWVLFAASQLRQPLGTVHCDYYFPNP